MLFDDYIFYKIESHADISEEIDESPPENRMLSYLRNKSMLLKSHPYIPIILANFILFFMD